jgi:hypothetical protein
MAIHLATATYQPAYGSPVAAYIAPYQTTRRGQRVTAYRWHAEGGQHVGYLPFATVERGMRAVATDHRFTNVALAE